VLLRAVDISSLGEAPIRENSTGYALYFVAFVAFGNFILQSLFVGAIVEHFTLTLNRIKGTANLSNLQLQWMEVHHILLQVGSKAAVQRAPLNGGRARKAVYRFVSSRFFDNLMVGMILLNTVCMMLPFYNMPAEYATTLAYLNYFFSAVFIAEFLLRFVALGWHYFASSANMFDFFIVAVDIAALVLIEVLKVTWLTPSAVKLFRITRVVRLVERFESLRRLLLAASSSLPALSSIGALLLLIHIQYAVAGMMLFQGYRGEELNDHANFDTFFLSLNTLFRCTTGESYNAVLHDLMYTGPDHSLNLSTAAPAMAFMITFILFSQVGVLSLFVGAVVEGVEKSKKAEQADCPIGTDDVREFVTCWYHQLPQRSWYEYYTSRVDQRDAMLSLPLLRQCLQEMKLALAISDQEGEVGDERLLAELNLPLYKEEVFELRQTNGVWAWQSTGRVDCVEYYDVLMALCNRKLESKMEAHKERIAAKVLSKLSHKVTKRFKGKDWNALQRQPSGLFTGHPEKIQEAIEKEAQRKKDEACEKAGNVMAKFKSKKMVGS
jgi:hypothetical protein